MIRRLKIASPDLSDWEGSFLESVEGRVQTYGRAFADPEKGGRDSALSVLQARKLKEITSKAKAASAPTPSDTDAEEGEAEASAETARPVRRTGFKSGSASRDWRRRPLSASRS